VLPLFFDEQVKNVVLGIQLISLTIVLLDQLLLVYLRQIVVLVNFWLPNVLPLWLLVFSLCDSVLHNDFIIELFKEFFNYVNHFRFFLFVKLLLLLLEILELCELFVALGESRSIEHIILIEVFIIFIGGLLLLLIKLFLQASDADVHGPEIPRIVIHDMVVVIPCQFQYVRRMSLLH
jgi:hypothetical protein